MRIIGPQEMAKTSRDTLIKAIKTLGEAQAAVADAMTTLDWFERRFQEGQYKELSTEEIYKMKTGKDYPDYNIVKRSHKKKNDITTGDDKVGYPYPPSPTSL